MYTNSNYFPDMSGFADTAGYSFSLDAAGDGGGAAGTPTNQGTNVDATAPAPYKYRGKLPILRNKRAHVLRFLKLGDCANMQVS